MWLVVDVIVFICTECLTKTVSVIYCTNYVREPWSNIMILICPQSSSTNSGKIRGGIAQLVSRPLLMLGTQVRILVGAWLRSPNACMRGEEITCCKSHIASVNLLGWLVHNDFLFLKQKTNSSKIAGISVMIIKWIGLSLSISVFL